MKKNDVNDELKKLKDDIIYLQRELIKIQQFNLDTKDYLIDIVQHIQQLEAEPAQDESGREVEKLEIKCKQSIFDTKLQTENNEIKGYC